MNHATRAKFLDVGIALLSIHHDTGKSNLSLPRPALAIQKFI